MYVWDVERYYDSSDKLKRYSVGLYSDKEKALSAVRFDAYEYDDKEVTEISECSTMIKVCNHNNPTKWETYFIEKRRVM